MKDNNGTFFDQASIALDLANELISDICCSMNIVHACEDLDATERENVESSIALAYEARSQLIVLRKLLRKQNDETNKPFAGPEAQHRTRCMG